MKWAHLPGNKLIALSVIQMIIKEILLSVAPSPAHQQGVGSGMAEQYNLYLYIEGEIHAPSPVHQLGVGRGMTEQYI